MTAFESQMKFAKEQGVEDYYIKQNWEKYFTDGERAKIIKAVNDKPQRYDGKKLNQDIRGSKEEVRKIFEEILFTPEVVETPANNQQQGDGIDGSDLKIEEEVKLPENTFAENMLFIAMIEQLFSGNVDGDEETLPAEIKAYFLKGLKTTQNVLFSLLDVPTKDWAEVTNLGIRYAMAPLLGTPPPEKPASYNIETYARVFKIEYQKLLQFPADITEEKLHAELKEKIISAAAERMVNATKMGKTAKPGALEKTKAEITPYFKAAVVTFEELMKAK